MKIKILFTLLFALITTFSKAQQPQKSTASEIYESIQKLNFLGSVLYIAAHPDDENTKVITHLANHTKAQVTYLSITRGDGGQNLIGNELRDLLGVIRTYELLEARKTDGGKQHFTRAVDFGYSKHPDETFAIWNKDEILSDVVLTIRKLQPDIIINRFDHRTPGSTHGHHTAAGILGFEAFDLAGNKNAFPNQLSLYSQWQPKRLFFNTSWWFYGSQENFEKADKSNLVNLATGKFYPSLGLSNSEIAALSRSKHSSQGFGNTGARGNETEYLELLKGDFPKDNTHIFDGIDTSWNRIEGGQNIGKILYQVEKEYNFKNPAASVPQLIEAYKLLKNRTDHWGKIKTQEIKEIIAQCSGLFLEAVTHNQNASPEEEITLKLEAINRSDITIQLEDISFQGKTFLKNPQPLSNNQSFIVQEKTVLLANTSYTSPYWLQEKATTGLHTVSEMELIGLPIVEMPFPVTFQLNILGEKISLERNLVYKYNSPVNGETYQPFQVLPQITGKFEEKVILFPNEKSKEVNVIVQAQKQGISGRVFIEHPDNWIVSAPQNFEFTEKGEEKTFTFTVTPPKNQTESSFQLAMNIDGTIYHHEIITIDYNHIPYQKVLVNAEAKVSKIELTKKGENIGYITGAGDAVPDALRQIGYQVTEIYPETMTQESIQNFDAIVLGIRAYNTVKSLQFKQQLLFDYVKNGGNVIVQYNTSRELLFDEIAPYPITLSRDRVTDENARVTFINPSHKVLNYPNKITEADFNYWIQERGLYFANQWAEEFTPILQMNDSGEKPMQGSLLIAQHGKGYFTYTGLSFFRQLPEGVSGAYRLFTNLLSLSSE